MYAIRSYYGDDEHDAAGPDETGKGPGYDADARDDQMIQRRPFTSDLLCAATLYQRCRITSYNVCYTKLLRFTSTQQQKIVRSPKPRLIENELPAFASRFIQPRLQRPNFRITSYNVCYTKLLRSWVTDRPWSLPSLNFDR